MGRIFQDASFNVDFAAGKRIVSVLASVAKHNPNDQPDLLYIELESLGWQQLFLDAGCGFWENWEKPFKDQDEDDKLINYGKNYAINGEIIKEAHCVDGHFKILLSSGSQFSLSPVVDFNGNEKSVFTCQRSK